MNTLEDIVYAAVDELVQTTPDMPALPKAPDTVLLGNGASLDSMGLVSLVVFVETHVEDHTGAVLVLASEQAMSRRRSPFRTLQTLADYVDELLAASGDPK